MALPSTSSDSKWTSPLRQSLPTHVRPESKVSRCLFGSPKKTEKKVAEACHSCLRPPSPFSYDTISTLYEIDFFNSPKHKNITEFFEIRELVLQIETFLDENNPKDIDIDLLRFARIQVILKSEMNHVLKMGELGLVLFYLTHPERLFPQDEDSLIAYRAQEIEAEVCSLIEQDKDIASSGYLASGKTHYLLRAFSHMALTSQKVFNKGGLYALIAMLEAPQLKIAGFLKPEHYEHILIVVRQILSNTAFDTLFQRHIEVHPDLQNIIRCNLKLKPDDRVTSTHVLWNCLMFLFFDIRQNERLNCYAIGGLIYATENAPYKVLDTMLLWLESGHFPFNDHLNIPIAPLLKKRLVYTKDMQIELESRQALAMRPVQHMAATMGVDTDELGSEEVLPLRTILSTFLQLGEYGETFLNGFKTDFLVHTALAIMEFSAMNKPETSFDSYSQTKNDFIHFFMSIISKQLDINHFRPLLEKIRQKIGEKIWLENCAEDDVSLKKGVIRVGAKRIRNFRGNRQNLVKVFKDSLRLFYLDNEEYRLLESITDLQNILCAIVDEAKHELETDHGYLYKKTAFRLKKDVSSENAKRQIANYAARQINQNGKLAGITGKVLAQSNLLVFYQIGGNPGDVLRQIFDMEVVIQKVSGATTPYGFAQKLFRALKRLDATLFKATPRILAFTGGEHIWTISPNRLRCFFDSERLFIDFIQATIFDKANARMRSQIPSDTIDAVIDRYANTEEINADMKEYFRSVYRLTFDKFRDELLGHATRYQDAKNIIDDEFARIRASEIKLVDILEQLSLDVPELTQLSIAAKLGDERLLPHQIATKLRKVLIDEGVCIEDPYILEIAIRHVYDLPIVFEIGDTNYDEGEYREDPPHQHIVIRYDWANKTLAFYDRDSLGETRADSKQFERFEIQHPPVKPSTHTFWD